MIALKMQSDIRRISRRHIIKLTIQEMEIATSEMQHTEAEQEPVTGNKINAN